MHALVTSGFTGILHGEVRTIHGRLGKAEFAWTQRKLPDAVKTGDIVYLKVLSLGRTTLRE